MEYLEEEEDLLEYVKKEKDLRLEMDMLTYEFFICGGNEDDGWVVQIENELFLELLEDRTFDMSKNDTIVSFRFQNIEKIRKDIIEILEEEGF